MENNTMENTGLALQGSVTPAVINYNFDELKEKLNKKLSEYQGLVVTDDSLKGAKNARKELASLRTQVEEVRKAVKKKASESINESDAKFKELTALITDAEIPLKEAIDVFDEKKRKENENLAKECIESLIASLNLRDKFAQRLTVRPEYLNLTTTKKAIREGVAKDAELLKKEQDMEDDNIKSVQNFVEAQNERISIKISADVYVSLILSGYSLSDVLAKIKVQADSIFNQEQEAERKRAEEEKKKEELKVEDATFRFGGMKEEDIASLENTANSLETEKVPAEENLSIPDSANPIMEAAEIPMEVVKGEQLSEDASVSIPAFLMQEEKVEIKKEKEFEVNFIISGSFSVLREVSEFLKMKKESGLLTMNVVSQKEI